MTKATLYTKPGCVQCKMTKKDLTKKGIPFDEIDITEDHDALQFVLGLGYKQAPVVLIGQTHWSGFRPDMVRKFV